jgi:putative DNA primase/helicase
MRVMGSLDLVAVARAAFIVVDEQRMDRRLFLPAKNNIAAARSGLAYCIEPKVASDGATSSAVVWDATPVTMSADEALTSASKPEQQLSLTDAVDFLNLILSAGPMPVKAIMSEARDAGVSAASLRRAARTLQVKSRRVGGLAGAGHWVWQLPEGSAAHEGGCRSAGNKNDNLRGYAVTAA